MCGSEENNLKKHRCMKGEVNVFSKQGLTFQETDAEERPGGTIKSVWQTTVVRYFFVILKIGHKKKIFL